MNHNFEQDTVIEVQAPPSKKGALVTAGMILGIIGVATSFAPTINDASFVMGILAVVFGAVGLVKRLNKGKAVAALVLGIIAIVITFVVQDQVNKELDYLTGDRSEDILENYLTVDFGTFTVIEDEYWDDTELTVSVRNKSGEKKSFLITVEAIDRKGNRIDTDIIYANDLLGGQRQDFTVFDFVTSDKIEAFKKASFRVIEVSMY